MAKTKKTLVSNKKNIKKTVVVKKTEPANNKKTQAKPIRTIALPEVVVTAKRINKTNSDKKQSTTVKKTTDAKKTNFKNSASTNVITPQKKATSFAKGKKIVDPFEQVLDAPQKSAMYLMGKGYKKPSEAMNIKNKYAATAVDTVLDPVNALFFLKGAKLGKAAKEAAKPRITEGINLTNPRNAARIVSKGKKYKAAAASSDAQSVYNDLTKKTK